MFPYAKLSPGPGFQAGRAALYYAQRLVTAPPARNAVSALIAANVRRRHGPAADWPLEGAGERALEELRRDGLAMLAPPPRAEIAAMADYFRVAPVVGPRGEPVGLDELPAGTAAAGYSLDTVLACPGLLALLNTPRFLGLAAAYLGCKPTLSSVGVRWTFPSAKGAARFQGFHRDVDDWRFLKLFIYITDVDEGSGPHTFVRTSHRSAFGVTAPRYTADALAARFTAGNIATVTGPAGTTFIADTLGVHRGGRPTLRPRLMLQVQYSLLPVFAFLYHPRAGHDAMFDAYCNRLLLAPGGAHQTGDTGAPASSARRARTPGAVSAGRLSAKKKSAASISRPQAGAQGRQEPAS
jgi:hypothetical protein